MQQFVQNDFITNWTLTVWCMSLDIHRFVFLLWNIILLSVCELSLLYCGCLVRNMNCLPFASTWAHPLPLGKYKMYVLLIFLVFCVAFCFLRPVSCGPNVVSASLLSILDCPSVFSIVYLCLGAVTTKYILNICALKNIYWSTLIKIISSQHHLHSNILVV